MPALISAARRPTESAAFVSTMTARARRLPLEPRTQGCIEKADASSARTHSIIIAYECAIGKRGDRRDAPDESAGRHESVTMNLGVTTLGPATFGQELGPLPLAEIPASRVISDRAWESRDGGKLTEWKQRGHACGPRATDSSIKLFDRESQRRCVRSTQDRRDSAGDDARVSRIWLTG